MNILDALLSLRPGSIWDLEGNDYNGLKWRDPTQAKPTLAEISTELSRLQAEYAAKEYQRLRAQAYPDYRDYLDGIVKGDAAQVQKYVDDCMAVKARFPK